jgi:hypothetical protein
MQLAEKVDLIHVQLDELSKGQVEMQRQVKELYVALTGNKLGQVGIIKRVETLESEYYKLNKFKTKMIGIGIGAAAVSTIIIEFLKYKLGF